jgi:myo-inositol-1(or 4)-monophosphatase
VSRTWDAAEAQVETDTGWVLHELHRLADRCRVLVREAGTGRRWTKLTDDGRREVVSELDVRIERVVQDGLMESFPCAGVFTEESSHSRAVLDADLCFVIDPIDGTREYLAGRSSFAISVAVLCGGVPRLGMIDFPARDQRFVCLADKAVLLNGRPLSRRPDRPYERQDECIRLAVSPAQFGSGQLGCLLDRYPRLQPVVAGSVTNKLALLCLGDVDAAVYLPLGDGAVALWDFLGFAVGLPVLGLGFGDLAGTLDLVTCRPTFWHQGWVAGTERGRAALRRAVRASCAVPAPRRLFLARPGGLAPA